MRARNLTLTSIGLPVRAELRLKSLLEVVNARTTDRWSFIEQGDAHVAICDPASALSSVTMKRLASGATRFFSLVEDASHAAAFEMHVMPAARTVHLLEPVDDEGLRGLAAPGVPISIRELPAAQASELVAQACKLLPELPVDACVANSLV